MSDKDVHTTVAEAYTGALERSREQTATGCCGGANDAPVSQTAALAGYGEEAAVHEDAAASSFGCGNPLAFAGVQKGDTVLDLGAGAGFDLLIAADRVGPEGHVIGIDMTDAMIDAARENAAKAGFSNVDARKGLIEDLPVDDASVDWVISNCVINLSPEKDRVFAEIHRVLRPGGAFAISDIVVEDLPAWIREHTQAYVACVAGAISESDYVAGLCSAGLDGVEVTDRLVYSADQIKGMLAGDFANLGLDPSTLDADISEVDGKVWSAKFTGRRKD
ncbi:MAG: arsenite methyltransferase [Acidimicrobiia bacterium]|nr:arsenite methyltransferase [Acidimicrobiia bacterium]